jgi:hypothetical protein
MNRREQLLAGTTSINRREFNAREDSQDASTHVGESVERVTDERELSSAGVTTGRVQTNQSNLPADEVSLEGIIEAQVIGKKVKATALELEIADSRARTSELELLAEVLREDIVLAQRALEAIRGNDTRSTNAKDPIPKEEPGLKAEAKENK